MSGTIFLKRKKNRIFCHTHWPYLTQVVTPDWVMIACDTQPKDKTRHWMKPVSQGVLSGRTRCLVMNLQVSIYGSSWGVGGHKVEWVTGGSGFYGLPSPKCLRSSTEGEKGGRACQKNSSTTTISHSNSWNRWYPSCHHHFTIRHHHHCLVYIFTLSFMRTTMVTNLLRNKNWLKTIICCLLNRHHINPHSCESYSILLIMLPCF